MRLALLAVTAIMLFSAFSRAGVFEIGAQANYKSTNYDPTHSDIEESGTGSLGYYFWQTSALEISYTRGQALQNLDYTSYEDFTSYGIDMLITFAGQNSAFKPYIKFGAAYVIKSLLELFNNGTPAITITTQGIAPSAGIGLKWMIGSQFALKGGFDVSSSPMFLYSSNSPDPNTITYDISAYGGLSFFF